MNDYLIVESSVLPDYFLKVLEARKRLASGVCTQVSDAVREVGISRSTFYKYKDKILEPSQLNIGKKATLILQLTHEKGVLSGVLGVLSSQEANVLTVSQSLPVRGQATVMLTVDMTDSTSTAETMVVSLQKLKGVEKVRLMALE